MLPPAFFMAAFFVAGLAVASREGRAVVFFALSVLAAVLPGLAAGAVGSATA